ncbi:MAG TPA: DEAD/DEAH box helicase, partial [Kofleriaceae bacterium]|nr:DEAD/DEAH box helicase [Kofleriaceae bacterium]
TERLGAARAIVGNVECTPAIATPAWSTIPEREAAIVKTIGAHLDHRGPVTGKALASELGLPVADVLAALLALEGDGAILRGTFTSNRPFASRTVRDALASTDELDHLEWCNRRVLARIHRLTLARLRKEIEPVSAAALMRFMLRWQRVARNTQVIGADGLARVVEQLQGFETAAGAWERELLPARLHGYDASWLDQMCLAGHVVWCRLSPRKIEPVDETSERDDAATVEPATAEPPPRAVRLAPSRSAPLSLMLRRDATWLRAAAITTVDDASLSVAAARVRDHLHTAGASFLSDLVGEIPPDEVEDALWELVAAGLATADGFASLRVLVDRKRGEVKSLFDRRLDTALTPARKWQEAIRRARTRDRERPGHALRSLPTAAGRWSLLPQPPPLAPSDAEAWARQLLHRYGVVFRDLIQRESGLPPWRDILVALRRLEARGEIRGGRFVTGFVGEQFALNEALDELRAARNPAPIACVVRIAATDPLNLVGILSPGPRVPAVVGNAVLYVDGHAVASLEAGELVRRALPPQGGRIDDDLTYHPPPRPIVVVQQAALPL